MWERERAEDECVEDGEDGDGRSDADGEDEYDGEGKARSSREGAESVECVAAEGCHEWSLEDGVSFEEVFGRKTYF